MLPVSPRTRAMSKSKGGNVKKQIATSAPPPVDLEAKRKEEEDKRKEAEEIRKAEEERLRMEEEERRKREEQEKLAAFEKEIEAQARIEQKKEFRCANKLVWQQGKADPNKHKNLDSNIKKNTAFIKKCRTSLAADSSQQLLNDINKLSLEKYISEIVGAIVEGMAKCKFSVDVFAAVEVVSALHQRFPDTFTPLLTYTLARSLAPSNRQHLSTLTPEQRDKEETSRVTKQRVLLRIAGELWLTAVLRNVDDGMASLSAPNVGGVETHKDNVAGLLGAPVVKEAPKKEADKDGKGANSGGFMYSVMKDLLVHDKEHSRHDRDQHVNLPLAVSFLKNFGPEMLGIVPRKQRAAAEQATGPDAPAKAEDDVPAKVSSADPESVVTPERRAQFKNLLLDYYESVERHLLKEHKEIRRLDRHNHETLITRGDLSEETKQNYEKAMKSYEKFLANTQNLADALDVEMPDLPEEQGTTKISIIREGGSSGFGEDKDIGNGIWEDEDARSFYENLANLKVLVPGVLLEGKTKKGGDDKDEREEEVVPMSTTSSVIGEDKTARLTEKDEPEGAVAASGAGDDTNAVQDAMIEIMDRMGISGDDVADGTENGKDEESEGEAEQKVGEEVTSTTDREDTTDAAAASGSTGKTGQLAQLDALLARLPQLSNRDLIDTAAVEFCYLNSKASRKKLAKALISVPRSRLDLLPYYARLVAALNPYFPDVGATVLSAFRNCAVLKNSAISIDSHDGFRRPAGRRVQSIAKKEGAGPVGNIRFLSELTKFRITPQHVIFHCFKVVLDDFTNHNVEVACNLLETCGRFLFKSPETCVRMGNMLEIMMRKKNVQHLDNRQILMIENAYYQANPPDRSAMTTKQRSPMEQYTRKLIYGDLNKRSIEKVLKQLRKLHWEDKEVYSVLLRCFAKIWKIKYSNIHLLAILVSGLHRYHSDFGVALVDQVIEDIRAGLELNIFKHNQRRIATVKYLGELYNYRMVDSPLIFDTLYSIVTLGHDYGRPARERICAIDAPDDFFRIRLCCTLLDTCGMCFDRGSAKKKLDSFLTFFQMYILSKHNVPMDVDFMIADTFEMLRPNMLLYKTYEEANEAVDRMLLEQLKSVQGADGSKVQEDGFEESELSETSSDDGDDEERGERGLKDDDEDDGENSEDEDSEGAIEDDDEEDVVVLTNKEERVPDEDDEEFEKEFSRMIAESIEARKFERKAATLDVPIPMHLLGGQVPADSALAINTRTKQEAEREEQQQLKQIVLSYEEREEASLRQAQEEQIRQRNARNARGRKVLHLGGGAGAADNPWRPDAHHALSVFRKHIYLSGLAPPATIAQKNHHTSGRQAFACCRTREHIATHSLSGQRSTKFFPVAAFRLVESYPISTLCFVCMFCSMLAALLVFSGVS
ncbi:nonsense-mediated mRNA decay 2 protein [Jimgerdemannia flammicorona]|uniref:Nonsense-mediated mRNA decay 2 protein n=1 Tax=Jimgerdemannia flammicorona TaxID=994334 RepID=A0A433D679_9FUNG|nr:nonsense-mediated mRNA decay 2 protein [Jimgerdemannia flammicorona]